MTHPSLEGDSTDPGTPGVMGTNTGAPGYIRSGVGSPGPPGSVVAEISVPETYVYAPGVSGTNWQDGVGVQGYSVSGNGGQFTSTNGNGVYGSTANGNMSGVRGENTDGGNGVHGTSISGNAVVGQSQTGNAGVFDGHVQHNGDVTTTGTHTVHGDIVLTQAADCAEEFDVTDPAEIKPGTVVVLDHHGALRSSQQAYDKKVAGVISGAGGYKPGMILDKKDASEGRMPVALVGKVYCKVDAQYAPVEVGDLLTTSPTPGHAMKADDPVKAFGSVLGKALRPLPAGQAMIPVLIALQ